jgi:hypothetical protein
VRQFHGQYLRSSRNLIELSTTRRSRHGFRKRLRKRWSSA